MAVSASGFIFTNHCVDRYGSTTAPLRSLCPTWCTWSSILIKTPISCISFTICLRHSLRSRPWYLPAAAFIVPLSSITVICGKSCRRPTSKSFGSCAGVILTAPLPKSFSTYSSPIIGISRPIIGKTIDLPIR
ncbi:hypothetical protein D3C78_652430 [compost metagenome]